MIGVRGRVQAEAQLNMSRAAANTIQVTSSSILSPIARGPVMVVVCPNVARAK